MEKLYSKLEFYQNAYNESSKDKKSIEKTIINLKNVCTNSFRHVLDEYFGDTISEEEEKFTEEVLGIPVSDIQNNICINEENLKNKIIKMKDTVLYKDYLGLLIDKDLDIVSQIEQEDTFVYLLEQGYGTEKFVNEPFVLLFNKFKYQPRLWKFNKYSNKFAKDKNFESYNQILEIYNGIRSKYSSLSNTKDTVNKVLSRAKKLDEKINELQEEIFKLPSTYMLNFKNHIESRLFDLDVDKLYHFISHKNNTELNAIYDQIKVDIETISNNNNKISKLSDRMNVIMSNINDLDELIYQIENKNVTLTQEQINKIINNDNPLTPVFEIIPKNEWKEIKESFKEKSISLKDESNYVRKVTKLTKKEKDAYLKEYGVKEGEIFIDKNLVNR